MKPRLIIALSVTIVVAAAAVACGGSAPSSDVQSREGPSSASSSPPNSKCLSWLGGGVAAAMCNPLASQPLRITLDQRDARYGSAVGIAQAMGRPLRNGDEFHLDASPAGTELLVRLEVDRPRFATALFRLPQVEAGSDARVDISTSDGRLDVELLLTDRSIAADQIYLPQRVG